MIQLDINKNVYKCFVKYAFKTCDSFSLVFKKHTSYDLRYDLPDIYNLLAESVVYSERILFHPDTGSMFQDSDIVYFKCDYYAQSVFMHANNMLDWDGVSLPEEICFYRNNKKWFVLISHAQLMFIYNETKEDIEFLNGNHIKYHYSL